MVAQDTDNNLHTGPAQGLEVFFVVVQQELHVRVVVDIDAIALSIPVDVGGKEHHVVEEVLAALGHKLQGIQRVHVVHLEIEHVGNSIRPFVWCRQTAQVFHQEHHVLHVLAQCHPFGSGGHRQRHNIRLVFLHVRKGSQRHPDVRQLLVIGSQHIGTTVIQADVGCGKQLVVRLVQRVVRLCIRLIHGYSDVHALVGTSGQLEHDIGRIFIGTHLHHGTVAQRLYVDQLAFQAYHVRIRRFTVRAHNGVFARRAHRQGQHGQRPRQQVLFDCMFHNRHSV